MAIVPTDLRVNGRASEFCILDKGRRVAGGSIGELTDQVVRAHLSV